MVELKIFKMLTKKPRLHWLTWLLSSKFPVGGVIILYLGNSFFFFFLFNKVDKEENANILAQRYGAFILKPSLFFPQRWPYYKQLHSLWWFFNSHFYKKVCTNWWLFILSFSVVIQEYIISQKKEIVKMFPPQFPQALFFNSHILDEKRICFCSGGQTGMQDLSL